MKIRSKLVLPLCIAFYELLVYLSNDFFLPALPRLMQDLRISESQGQYTITAWFVGAASFQLIIGPLSDRVGRRFVLLASGLIFMLASLFASLSTYYWLFICMRCCQGFAVAAIAIAGYGMIFEVMERREAAITVAWMSALTVIAPAAGPLLGALWLNYFDWRLSFVMLTLLAALPVFGFALLLPKASTLRTKFSLTEIMCQSLRSAENRRLPRTTRHRAIRPFHGSQRLLVLLVGLWKHLF